MSFSVFRDDDISVTTDLRLLQQAHEIIVSAGKIHTVAVEMKDLALNREVWHWLHTTPGLNVCLHGWDHKRYDGEGWLDNSWGWQFGMTLQGIKNDLTRSLDYWRDVSARGCYKAPEITVFLPPWNKTSAILNEACAACGLTVDARHGKGTPVYLFHYWDPASVDQLQRVVL